MIKHALITGASSGIGYNVALELARKSIKVLGISRNKEKLQTLKNTHDGIHVLAADVTDLDTYADIKDHYKGIQAINYIVICAGQAGSFGPLINSPLDELKRSLDLDVIAPLKLLQTLSEHLPNTRVLFIGSYSSQTPRHNWAVYSIGKASQLMVARCLKKENQDLKIGIYYPGAVQTDIFQEAVSKSVTEFPDQPIYQHFIDTNTVKTPKEAAQHICNFLLNTLDEEFVASCDISP